MVIQHVELFHICIRGELVFHVLSSPSLITYYVFPTLNTYLVLYTLTRAWGSSGALDGGSQMSPVNFE